MKKIVYLFIIAAGIYGCKDSGKQKELQDQSTRNFEKTEEDLTDDIQIKNIQIGSETTNDKNKFHTSYPSTKYIFLISTRRILRNLI